MNEIRRSRKQPIIKYLVIALMLLTALSLTGCGQRSLVDLPEDFPEIQVSGRSDISGEYLTTANGKFGFYLMKMNEKGQITWLKKVNDYNKDHIGRCINFNKVAGKDLYYFFQVGKGFESEYANTDLVILNENYEEVKRVRYEMEDGLMELDFHDAVVFDRNHYIVCTAREERVNNIPADYNKAGHETAAVTYIQEIENGKVKWEFRSADHPQLYRYKINKRGDYDHFREDYSDYMHFNSFAIDPKDENLLVSFRSQCSVIKLNRENGEIMWIMGGLGDEFGLPKDTFLCQHALSFTDDGNLLMYNNNVEGVNSSILELAIDERNKKAEVVHSLPLEVDSVNYGWVRKLDGSTYLVNYGETTGLDDPVGFREIDADTGEDKIAVTGSSLSKYVQKNIEQEEQ